jgi:putative FmdB family regulatory protein
MPTYDYRCPKCGHVFELFHSMKDDAPKKCPKCRTRARRVPAGGAGLLFKGSGFYITDNRSSGYREQAKQEKGGDSGTKEKGGDSGAKDKGRDSGAKHKGGDAGSKPKKKESSGSSPGSDA